YFVNLMGQPGETTNFTASDHVRAIQRHVGADLLDYVVVNVRPIPPSTKKRYARESAAPVKNDLDALFRTGVKIMAGRLAQLSQKKAGHVPAESAAVVIKLAQEARRNRIPRA